ncbi:MAG: hypothetical protein DMD50_15750 [Gemmatimonadetes bacterium]|nr:MAG: hypothetical protein DMD50_15750 [Gemmatimonadota bacterium]
MKRVVLTLGLAAYVAMPAAAQWLGEPMWTPKSGTGFTIYGDYGRPNTDAGKGNAFGGRVALGLSTFTLSAGVASWKPEAFGSRVTSYGGTASFRLIGGSLIPVGVNLQVGAAHSGEVTSGTQTLSAQTTVNGAVALSVPLPTPGMSIEPYFSPGIRYHKVSTVPIGTPDHETNFGWVIGGNLGFGLVGIHVAYDSEKFDDGTTHGVFGIGANVGLRLPMGL